MDCSVICFLAVSLSFQPVNFKKCSYCAEISVRSIGCGDDAPSGCQESEWKAYCVTRTAETLQSRGDIDKRCIEASDMKPDYVERANIALAESTCARNPNPNGCDCSLCYGGKEREYPAQSTITPSNPLERKEVVTTTEKERERKTTQATTTPTDTELNTSTSAAHRINVCYSLIVIYFMCYLMF